MSLQRFRIPATPFPPPGPAGAPFPGFCGTTKMLRLPAARPSRFVSFAPQVPRDCTVREGAGSCCCRLLVGVAPVPQSSPFDPDSRERQDLPSSRENPNVRAPCSPTPAGSLRQAITTLGCCRPRSQTDRLPRLNPPFGAQSHGSRHSLSTLRGSDYSDRHHARLASGWRPTFAGQGSDLLGSR